MMRKNYLTFILLILVLCFSSTINYAQVTDIDGNTYNTVIIGTQEWMAENLKSTRFSNGDVIPNVTDINDFYYQGAPAWAYYANNSSNGDIYGKLYNGFVATDNRNCCPTGWHVPTDAEWITLRNFAGGEAIAGGKLKNSNPWNGTDDYGFNAMPGGLRYALAGDLNEGSLFGQGFWWSSEYVSSVDIYFYRAETFATNFYRAAENYTLGMSIRCIKDSGLSIDDNGIGLKKSFVYPNPFSSTATLVLNSSFNGSIILKIFNANGQLVKEISKASGQNVTIDSNGLTEGFYFYTVQTDDNKTENGKFIIKK